MLHLPHLYRLGAQVYYGREVFSCSVIRLNSLASSTNLCSFAEIYSLVGLLSSKKSLLLFGFNSCAMSRRHEWSFRESCEWPVLSSITAKAASVEGNFYFQAEPRILFQLINNSRWPSYQRRNRMAKFCLIYRNCV